MRVLIIDYPWGKTWLDLYAKAFNRLGHEVAIWDGRSNARIEKPDVVLCTWADRDFTELFPEAKHSIMMRRYEYFHSDWEAHNWGKIDHLICCNPMIANDAGNVLRGKTNVHWICNPIDPSLWTYKERYHGSRIGMVARVHPVKNLPLAAQIVMGLPGFTLHVAGEINDKSIEVYLKNLLPSSRLVMHGRVENKTLNEWWEGMDYCLSTSISEGDPMNILEACAKGIKPIIHHWPGAEEMYPASWVFDSASMARQMIEQGEYHSNSYRGFVELKRPLSLANKVAETVLS